MPRRAPASSWTFTKRFRSGAFGWRSSRLACERLREATTELRAAAAVDPIRAADGAVLLCERLTPALQNVDSGSGALGRSTNEAVAVAIELLRRAPATVEVRRRWLQRLFEAFTDDGFGYLHDLGEAWGDLCVDDALAHEWLEALFGLCRTTLADPSPGTMFSGLVPCLSVLRRLGRHAVVVDLLAPLPSYHPMQQERASALAALGRTDEAVAAAMAAQPPNQALLERILREAGRAEEAWRGYGRLRPLHGQAAAHFRRVVADYPTLPPARLLRDLIETSPGDEAMWLASAVELGEHDLAIQLVQKSPANLATVLRIVEQQLDRAPRLVHAIALQTLRWIEGGRRGGATAENARVLVVGMLTAAQRLGLPPDEVVRSLATLLEGAGTNSLLAGLVANLPRPDAARAVGQSTRVAAAAGASAPEPGLPSTAKPQQHRAAASLADGAASTPPLGVSVSATFLAFVQPMLGDVGANEAARAALLQLATLAWNVVVFADDRGDASALVACRARLQDTGEESPFEWLVARRRSAFAAHRWLVRDSSFVVDAAGQLRLRVEAGH